MTTKTIKTIVFAALFAAMILPISGMQSVDAVHDNSEPHVPDGSRGDGVEVIPDGGAPIVVPDRTHVPEGAGDGIPDETHLPEGAVPDGTHGAEVPLITYPDYEVEIEIVRENTRGPPSPELDGSYMPEGEEVEVVPDGSNGEEVESNPDGSHHGGPHLPEGSVADGSRSPVIPADTEQ